MPCPPRKDSDESRIASLEIDAMSHGTDAVGRFGGRVVFVSGGAPGDIVDVEIIHAKRRFWRAVIRELRRPSPVRRPPRCEYVPRCGGCSWQHLEYEAQLEAKSRNLADHLTRIGGLENVPVGPIIRSPDEWRYRHRLNLRVQGTQLGFYRAESNELVEIERCAIAEPSVEQGLAAARRWLAAVKTIVKRLSIAASGRGGVVLAANCEGSLAAADDEGCARYLASQDVEEVRGIVMFGKGWRRSWGDSGVTFEPEADLHLTATAGEFTQVNLAANRTLVKTVVALADPRPGDTVLDLYCGNGNLGIPMARRGARVIGIERSKRSVADAGENARRLQLAGCTFVSAAVEDEIVHLASQGPRPETLILDPPRGGAAGLLGVIIELAPARIVYVSCDPPALARDLRTLVEGGYRIAAVQPIDLFPHTHHLEVVARLDQTRAS